MDPQDPRLGSTIAGVRLERHLGRGGMGAVYLGRRPDGVGVAVKVLAPELARDGALRARFLREGQALSRVRPHPHVVHVHAVVEAPEPCLVMELVPGGALSARLSSGRMPPHEAARLARDMALGLAALHAAGIVHRDVKPANVLLTSSGRAKLVDLGVAKDAFRSGLTAPGAVLGTVEYMAPEQWAGGAVDARTDLFALGGTLYALLCGRAPFGAAGGDLAEVAERCAAGEVEPPRALAPDIPEELERVVLRLLEPEPAWRPPSAAAVARDLERVLVGGRAAVPALVSHDGSTRLPLHPGRTFVLGAGPGASGVVAHPSVSPRHAEVRRKAQGFFIVDLRSARGTSVGGQRVVAPRLLAPGDVVLLGEVALAFDPASEYDDAPDWGRDVLRRFAPAPVVEALMALGDPRAAAALLERLAPDPLDAHRARRVLEALCGSHAGALAARREALVAGERDAVVAALARAAGQGPPDPDRPNDPAAWLAWWDAARASAPEQVGAEGRPAGLRLRVAAGPLAGAALDLERAPDVALLGSDPRCALSLVDPTVSRRHATVLRLHRRLLARNDDPGLGTLHAGAPLDVAFLDPGQTLVLGGVEVVLEAADAATSPATAPAPGTWLADATTFRCLEAARHPAAAAALLALRDVALVARWAEGWARILEPSDPARARALHDGLRAALAERAARAAWAAPGPGPRAWPAGWPA